MLGIVLVSIALPCATGRLSSMEICRGGAVCEQTRRAPCRRRLAAARACGPEELALDCHPSNFAGEGSSLCKVGQRRIRVASHTFPPALTLGPMPLTSPLSHPAGVRSIHTREIKAWPCTRCQVRSARRSCLCRTSQSKIARMLESAPSHPTTTAKNSNTDYHA
jgi:hypothetical protein